MVHIGNQQMIAVRLTATGLQVSPNLPKDLMDYVEFIVVQRGLRGHYGRNCVRHGAVGGVDEGPAGPSCLRLIASSNSVWTIRSAAVKIGPAIATMAGPV